MELGPNLLKRCKERKISLSELARLSGVKQPTLFGWTTGRAVHKLDDLRKVCFHLEISLHKLLFGTSDPFEGDEEILQDVEWGKVRIVMYLKNKGNI